MSVYTLQDALGRTIEIEGPPGLSEEQLIPEAERLLAERSSQSNVIGNQIANDPITQGALNFAQDMPTFSRYAAGWGKGLADWGRGASQLLGFGPSAEELREIRQRDAPLLATPAGRLGQMSADLATWALPFSMPIRTVRAAAAMGALPGMFAPAESMGERLGHMGTGAGVTGGLQAVGQALQRGLADSAISVVRGASSRQAQNEVRDETVRRAHEAGYSFSPSSLGYEGPWLGLVEAVAGKKNLEGEIARRATNITSDLARRHAGLSPNQAISEDALQALRQEFAQPYKDVAALRARPGPVAQWVFPNQPNMWNLFPTRGPSGEQLINRLGKSQWDSKQAWLEANKGNPYAREQAFTHDAITDALERRIDALASFWNQPNLLRQLQEARTNIAQVHDVQRVLNEATGDLSLKGLAQALNRGIPMSGNLETAALYARGFPQFAKDNIPPKEVFNLHPFAIPIMAGNALAYFGNAGLGAAATLLPLASRRSREAIASLAMPFFGDAATDYLLSSRVQNMLMPQYNVSGLQRWIANNPDMLNMLGTGARIIAPALSNTMSGLSYGAEAAPEEQVRTSALPTGAIPQLTSALMPTGANNYSDAITTAAQKYGVPNEILFNLARAESGFNPQAVSHKGARGLMQIVPKWHPGVNADDPFESIDYAARYLRGLYEELGSWEQALAAYNWGIGNLQRQGMARMPGETKQLLARVLSSGG